VWCAEAAEESGQWKPWFGVPTAVRRVGRVASVLGSAVRNSVEDGTDQVRAAASHRCDSPSSLRATAAPGIDYEQCAIDDGREDDGVAHREHRR
jgi:hypothetical protein